MPEELKEDERWAVVRVYSGTTARKRLWQCLSRGMKERQYADDWADFMRSQYGKDAQITVMKVPIDFL